VFNGFKVETRGEAINLRTLQNQQMAFVAAGGQLIRSEMVVRVPVLSGNLRNSIVTEAQVKDGKAMSETEATAFYASYVEDGTSKQAAQPYAEPGYQAADRQFQALANRILK
jgi:HK97 gp10 family phage protein